jgi:hypothetical protein
MSDTISPHIFEQGCDFSWEEKLVAPLIATPNVDKAIEDK